MELSEVEVPCKSAPETNTVIFVYKPRLLASSTYMCGFKSIYLYISHTCILYTLKIALVFLLLFFPPSQIDSEINI